MMKTVSLGLVVSLCVLLFGCRSSGRQVMVIEKTKSYHVEDCPRTRMAKTKAMTVSEARALQFRPCKECNPDTME